MVRHRDECDILLTSPGWEVADGGTRAADFFVSYTSADRPWAEWIAWQLKEAGSSVVLQAWDMVPGLDFIHEMQKATTTAKRTIAPMRSGLSRAQPVRLLCWLTWSGRAEKEAHATGRATLARPRAGAGLGEEKARNSQGSWSPTHPFGAPRSGGST